jgi:CheY-like chemotaxis protein
MTTDKRILVVDDEPSIRNTFATALRRSQYTVETAGSAEEALLVMERAPAEVLFLDLNLPGMNGLELCRQVRQNWPWSIAMAVTGYVSLFELVDCREAGFEDYFVKPVPLSDLLEAAEQAFKKIQRWKTR